MKKSELKGFFKDNNEQAAAIDEQNGRWQTYHKEKSDGQYDALPGLADAIDSGLRTEQTETIAQLSKIEEAPYLELYPSIEQCQRELKDLRELLGKSSDEIASLQEAALAAAARGLELAPRSEAEIEELLHTYEEEIAQRYNNIPVQVNQKEQELRELEEIAEIAGQAWPVPQFGHDFVVDTPQFVDRYDIKDEPRSNGCDVRKSPEYLYSKEMGASEKCAVLMLACAGESLTLQDIADIVYRDIEHEFKNREEMLTICANRVAMLINNVTVVDRILADNGHKMQRGYRYKLDSEGHQIGHRLRIQRALPEGDPRLDMPYEEHELTGSQKGAPSEKAVPVDESTVQEYEDISTHEGLTTALIDYYEDVYDLTQRLDSLNILPATPKGGITARTLTTRISKEAKRLKRCDLYKDLQMLVENVRYEPQRKVYIEHIVSSMLGKKYKDLQGARRADDRDMIAELQGKAIDEYYYDKAARETAE